MVMSRNDKEQKIEELVKLINSNNVIGVIDLEKIPAAAQLRIKNAIKQCATIRMSRKTILKKALEKSDKNNEEFADNFNGSCALIFTKENPFRIFKILKSNTVKSGAKTGQLAPRDISIPKGPTPIAPGPAISTFQKAGLKTKVEAGKISVIDEKVVVKQGEIINTDIVSVLNLLKIEPIELRINIEYVLEDGIIYGQSVLNIDAEDTMNNLYLCIQKAINFSVNIDYPTKLSIDLMIQKAYNQAKNLAVEANISEKEFINHVLSKAVREKNALEGIIGSL